jgi:hypothetical protein
MIEIETSKVRLGRHLTIVPSQKNLLNGEDCYMWLLRHKNLIGWTYNYNPHCGLTVLFDRLITCKGEPRNNIRIAENTHMKCYIHKCTMLVTSFNLSYPTVLDMGYVVTDMKAVAHMKMQFDKHWEQLNHK